MPVLLASLAIPLGVVMQRVYGTDKSSSKEPLGPACVLGKGFRGNTCPT